MEHATHTHASQLAKATSAENHRTHTNGNFMCPCVVCFVLITCSFAPGNTSLLRAVWALQCVIASMASLKQAFVLPPLKCPNWKRVLRSGSRHGVQGNCVFFLDRAAHFARVRELMRRCQDRIQKEWPGADSRVGPQDLPSHAEKLPWSLT